MIKLNLRDLRSDERGLVSFFVTIIIMIVLSITVLSFAKIADREQVNSNARALSTEAFYAAESGVNDAYAVVANLINAGKTNLNQLPSETQSCDVADSSPTGIYISNGGTANSSSILNTPANILYTCLLVTPNPQKLIYTPTPGQAIVTKLLSVKNAQPLTTVDLNYSVTSQDTACSVYIGSETNSEFPPNNQWPIDCPPVLRIDMVRIPPSFSTSTLQSTTRSFFIYPSNGGGDPDSINVNASSNVNGAIYYSSCTNTCQFSFNNLNKDGNNYPYYMRILAIYGASPPTYTFTGYSGTTQELFSGAQLQIDSTGEARNELRRIQVNVSTIQNQSEIPSPNYVIQTNNSICKRIVDGPSFFYENIPAPAPIEMTNIPSVSGLNPGKTTADPCNPLY